MTRRILIATDAWHPQVNGVVRTLDTTARTLLQAGHAVEVVCPDGFLQVPVPFYPEVSATFPRPGLVYDRVRRFRPDHVHIATEGPIGLVVRHDCRHFDWRFTTSYHTRFPEYGRRMAGIPEGWSYRYLRYFHNGAGALMVATPSLEKELISRGFTAPIRRWTRGVDLSLFYPRPKPQVSYKRPVLLYVGRVSSEKGIDDFLSLKAPGTKLVIGDGPARGELESRYPDAVFLGYRKGAELAEHYAAADLFVFPSRTDTFGIVLIEALASGLPVAAFPVTGPIDIVTDPGLGALDEDLGRAVDHALATGDPAACAAAGRRYTWENCTTQFLENLVPVK
jgi:glycosyltransferase involved in cell wall biosynthesis